MNFSSENDIKAPKFDSFVIPECDRCQLYAHSPYTVCAVHPFGINSNSCLDFRQDPNAELEELWEPEGARYIDLELVLERSYNRTMANPFKWTYKGKILAV